ncbi:MAG TPA: beta-N-acetylhexosaminidase [Flavitalea sp.]|nr:beta-N-acetylhexosaminidase [Flavitalea sp.]
MSFSRRKFLRASGLMTTAALLSVEQLMAAIEKNHTAIKSWDSGSAKESIINDLRSKGYSLIPAPQQLKLTGKDIVVDKSWSVSLTPAGKGTKALNSLNEGSASLHSLSFAKTGGNRIVLEVKAGTIKEKLEPNLLKQAYHLQISPREIRISADDETGLFYGVQSLLQLLRPEGNGSFKLPEGSITDWPALDLRFIHWDTKHHQDRMETLKRYIDWSALFKANAIAFEIEDKYEYPRHPIIGAPGAFTKKEMHELTAYAHARCIQLTPYVQAPAHMAYVLKHEEFAHLRADGSNFQICMCDEEAIQLIFDMYQDMIDATPGVDYFFASTDETYYGGTCAKCLKEHSEGKSQISIDYMNRAHKWLAERGRKMFCWIEPPVLPKHIPQLSPDIIDGFVNPDKGKEWIDYDNKAGIKQLAYFSMQGAEYLFSAYFGVGGPRPGSLEDAWEIVPGSKAMGAQMIGAFSAAWDSGVHNEAFWLGWAATMQYAWTAARPSIEQTVADFMDIYYGHGSPDMVEAYKLLEKGAKFYTKMWDMPVSKERGPGYTPSNTKSIDGGKRMDEMLDMPPIPSGVDLKFEPAFAKKYEQKIAEAKELADEMDKLAGILQQNISKVRRNKYNLEVFLSIAYLERYSVKIFPRLARVEAMLESASRAKDKPVNAVNNLINAHKTVGAIISELEGFWPGFTAVWEKSRFKKGRSVNGRDFVYIMDDVKDHIGDRRLGLEYMTAPFERMEMKKWREELWKTIAAYAKANNVPIAEAEEARLED